MPKVLQIDLKEDTVIFQTADDPEIGANGGLSLPDVVVGTWTATLTIVDNHDTFAVVMITKDGQAIDPASWTPSDAPSTDVNALCIATAADFPKPAEHDRWWKTVVDQVDFGAGADILLVDRVLVMCGTDCGGSYPVASCRVGGKLVGLKVEFPQA